MCICIYKHLYRILRGFLVCCNVLLQASCLVLPISHSSAFSCGCTLGDIQSPISSLETGMSLHTSASLWKETLSYLKGKKQSRKFVKKVPILSQEKTTHCVCDPAIIQELLHFQLWAS